MPLDNGGNHIPEAVRRASRRSDEIARAAGVANVPDDNVEATGTEESEIDLSLLPEGDSPPASTTAPTPEPVPEPVPQPPAVDWEQRYRTLQGKYDAELAQSRAQISSLERLIGAMRDAPPAVVEPMPAPTTVVAPTYTPEDIENYGEDLVKAVPRWVMPMLKPYIDKIEGLENELGQLRGGHQRLETMSVQQRVESSLDSDPVLAPHWRALNTDPEFLAWLAQVDPFSGVQRQHMLNDAASRGDAVRCGHFFKSYLAEHTAVTQTSAPAIVQTASTPVQADDRPTLESMAAPGRASGSAPDSGASAEKRLWTRNQITAFYQNCAKGRYAGREAERVRTEADIIAAASEGRIRN